MGRRSGDIASMPRGGFRASCLDRLLQTGRTAYRDRDDVDDGIARRVIDALDGTGRSAGSHAEVAAVVLDEVAEVPDPRILELGAGHGAAAAQLLSAHPTATVTVTDVDPAAVAAMAAGELGDDPRATVAAMDATAIDAPDGSFDVALIASTLHRLSPSAAARVFAEGTRVADILVVVDVARPAAPLHVVKVATMLPWALVGPQARFVHDGIVSSLSSYSTSALRQLARHADESIVLSPRRSRGLLQVTVASRRTAAAPTPRAATH